jgi:AsmA-like C-terminal region/Protein of unknown function
LTRFFKYTLKAILILFGILILLYLIVVIYVSVNKKSIIKDVTDEIGKKINGNVSIGDVELSFFRSFPNASVVLHRVLVTDTMYAQHHHPFFKADEVYAELSIVKLIEKKSTVNGIRIENASVYLFTDVKGYSNAYLLKPKSNPSQGATANTPEKNQLKSIELKNVRITVDDRLRGKLLDGIVNSLKVKMDDEDNTTYFSSKANILVNSLAFSLSNGSFVKGKKFEGNFKGRLDKKLHQLQFDSIDIKLNDQRFNVTGRFDLVKPDPQFSIRIHTRQIFYDFGKSLLPAKTDTALSIVSIDKKLDADADINGPLNGGDPLIVVSWIVTHAHLKTPFLNFDDASFTGYYTDEVIAGKPRRDPNSKIEISNFSATWNEFPVSSNHIEILNLYQPILTCDLNSSFPLIKLNELIGSKYIQLQSGSGLIDVTYNGPIEKNNNTNSFVNGKVSFKNGNVLYTPRNVELKNVNGRLEFKNSDVLIENLQCDVLNNKVIMNGEAKNLITLLTTEPNKAVIDWNIYSPSLNMASFLFLLKPGVKVSDNSNNVSKPKLNKLASSIDDVLNKGILNVNLKTPNLIYKKFEATNLVANVTLLENQYKINNVSMDHAGGHVNFNGSLVTDKENYHQAKINASLDNVDVSKIFSAFNNFGQNGIKAENLQGKLTATVNADVALSDEGKAYPNSIESVVNFSLKNGALNNFEPVKKIQSFIFKNRDFDNIRFAELKDSLEIKNQEIKINRMEIQSNVLSMYAEGIYSMKGTTDMSIQIPLSNLKKRGADYIPANEGVDKRAGPSLYLRGQPGADGSIQFKPEFLHMFRKSKDK